jgi:hypothetical protein
MKSIPQLSATFVLSLLLCSSVSGQSTGQISGTVTNQTGMALPAATIKVTQMDMGTAQSTITDQAGFYLIPNLVVGPYRVEVLSPGFRSYVRTGIHLEMGAGSVLNIQMDPGQATDQCLTALASLLQLQGRALPSVADAQGRREPPSTSPCANRPSDPMVSNAGMYPLGLTVSVRRAMICAPSAPLFVSTANSRVSPPGNNSGQR